MKIFLVLLALKLIARRRWIVLGCVILLSISSWYGYQSEMPKGYIEKNDDVKFVEEHKNEKFIFFTSPNKLRDNPYNRNERGFIVTETIPFYYYLPHVKIFSIIAAYPFKTNKLSQELITKTLPLKNQSTYYRECGELDFKNYDCLIDFMRTYDFSMIMSEFEISNPFLDLVETTNNFYYYQLTNREK